MSATKTNYRHRPQMTVEQLALRVLYDLATKVPKVILHRVEEVMPSVRVQIRNKAVDCGPEMCKKLVPRSNEEEVVHDKLEVEKEIESNSSSRKNRRKNTQRAQPVCKKTVSNSSVYAKIIHVSKRTDVQEANQCNRIADAALCERRIANFSNSELEYSVNITPFQNKTTMQRSANDDDEEFPKLTNSDQLPCEPHSQTDVKTSFSVNQQIVAETTLPIDPVAIELDSSDPEQNKNEHEDEILRQANLQKSETICDIQMKEEIDEDVQQDYALYHDIVDFKCEVKDEITLQEHEVLLQDVSFIDGKAVCQSDLSTTFVHPHSRETGDSSETDDEGLQTCSISMDDFKSIPQTAEVVKCFQNMDEIQSKENQHSEKLYITRIKDEIMKEISEEDAQDMEDNSAATENLSSAAANYLYQGNKVLKTSNNIKSLSHASFKQKDSSGTNLSSTEQRHCFGQAEQIFKCSLCGKSFPNAGTLKLHYGIHCGEQAHKCKVCSKVFYDLYKFKIHIRIHTDCPYKSFENSVRPKLNTTVVVGEHSFRCNFCGEPFESESSLKRHSRYHAGEWPYQCRLCYISFDDAHQHTGDRPYRCVLCTKCFVEEYQFIHHLRLHCQEALHVCKICTKEFSSLTSLKKHARNHREEWQHRCEVTYNDGSKSTEENLKVRSGNEPHVCSKVFVHSKNQEEHKQIHVDESSMKSPLNGDGLVSDCTVE